MSVSSVGGGASRTTGSAGSGATSGTSSSAGNNTSSVKTSSTGTPGSSNSSSNINTKDTTNISKEASSPGDSKSSNPIADSLKNLVDQSNGDNSSQGANEENAPGNTDSKSSGNNYLENYFNPSGYNLNDDSKQWLSVLAKNSNDQITFNEMADGYLKFQNQRMNNYLNPQPIRCKFQDQTFGGGGGNVGNTGFGNTGFGNTGAGNTGGIGYSMSDQDRQWLSVLARNSNDQITFNEMADGYLNFQNQRMNNYLNPQPISCMFQNQVFGNGGVNTGF